MVRFRLAREAASGSSEDADPASAAAAAVAEADPATAAAVAAVARCSLPRRGNRVRPSDRRSASDDARRGECKGENQATRGGSANRGECAVCVLDRRGLTVHTQKRKTDVNNHPASERRTSKKAEGPKSQARMPQTVALWLAARKLSRDRLINPGHLISPPSKRIAPSLSMIAAEAHFLFLRRQFHQSLLQLGFEWIFACELQVQRLDRQVVIVQSSVAPCAEARRGTSAGGAYAASETAAC